LILFTPISYKERRPPKMNGMRETFEINFEVFNDETYRGYLQFAPNKVEK
jgi:hypothetical protein